MPRLAVLGHPVAHSRSPAMQNAALAALGLDNEWRYEAIDLAPEEFERRVGAMADEGFAGANVTVPYKHAALELADRASEVALAIGAANTLTFTESGIAADNTDAGGLRDSLPGSPRGRRALVLGAGGAARAAILMLAREGGVVDVWNRTSSRASEVYGELGQYIELGGAAVDSPRQDIYGIVINTTMVGLRGESPFEHLPLAADGFVDEQVVVDMVYGPKRSAFLEAAEACGAYVVEGLEILVRQGARSLQIWTGCVPPLDVMRAAAYSLGDR
jgi:shikimate dehydrogenase